MQPFHMTSFIFWISQHFVIGVQSGHKMLRANPMCKMKSSPSNNREHLINVCIFCDIFAGKRVLRGSNDSVSGLTEFTKIMMSLTGHQVMSVIIAFHCNAW